MCFTERRFPALLVTIFSVIVLISGVIMIIESCLYKTTDSILNADLGSLTNQVTVFKNSSFAVLVTFSALAVIVGAFGACCLCKPFSSFRCFSIIYGLMLFGIWLGILVIGVLITTIS